MGLPGCGVLFPSVNGTRVSEESQKGSQGTPCVSGGQGTRGKGVKREREPCFACLAKSKNASLPRMHGEAPYKAPEQVTCSFPFRVLLSFTPSLFSRFFAASVRQGLVLDVCRGSREGCVCGE